MARYKVLVGIDYPPGKRAEPGDEVDDLPATTVAWLLSCGAIVDLEPAPEPARTPAKGRR